MNQFAKIVCNKLTDGSKTYDVKVTVENKIITIGAVDHDHALDIQKAFTVGAIEVRPMFEVAPDLLEAAKKADCECSVADRDSGHVIGCWMPELQDAIRKAEGRK